MKTCINIFLICLINIFIQVNAQEIPKPGSVQEIPIILRNASIHAGDGSKPYQADILIMAGKIHKIGLINETFKRSEEFDLTGKHIYPGLIALNTHLGLAEIEAARPTIDTREVGEYNPGLRSLVAYNTDSRVIGTVRSNGILIAQTITQSGIIRGTSAVVQLDAWNWEDAAIAGGDNALCIHWPQGKEKEKAISGMNLLFEQAAARMNAENITSADLNIEALIPVLKKERKVFIQAQQAEEILQAIAFADKHGIQIVITGGYQAWKVVEELKQRNIPVVLSDVHRLPATDEEMPDLPFKNAALLQAAGIKVCLSVEGFWQVRNLPFMAGTAAAYGLTKEEALKTITLNAAEVLGIQNICGSISPGKEAYLLIVQGDLLDMKTSVVEKALIQGRWVNLENKQTQLFEKYKR